MKRPGAPSQVMPPTQPASDRTRLLEDALASLARGRDSFSVSCEELGEAMLKLAMQTGRLDLAGELLDDIAADQLRAGGPASPTPAIEVQVTRNGREQP